MDARELENLMRSYMGFYLNAYYVLFSLGDSLFISLISQREHNPKTGKKVATSKFKTLYIKGHNQPSPKATYPMGDNNCNHISDKKLIPRIYKEL